MWHESIEYWNVKNKIDLFKEMMWSDNDDM